MPARASADRSNSVNRITVVENGQSKIVALKDLPLDGHGYVITCEETFDPPITPLDENGQGNPYAVYGFGAHMAEIEVDIELGTVRVLKVTAAHDVGCAINPTLIEGQIEGGVAQGLGMALMEEFFPGKGENLHDYLIPSAGDVPPIESILIEDPSPIGPFGAKGIGEQAVIPTAPAILNAIHDAIGVRIHKVPATPDRVRAAIVDKANGGVAWLTTRFVATHAPCSATSSRGAPDRATATAITKANWCGSIRMSCWIARWSAANRWSRFLSAAATGTERWSVTAKRS